MMEFMKHLEKRHTELNEELSSLLDKHNLEIEVLKGKIDEIVRFQMDIEKLEKRENNLK